VGYFFLHIIEPVGGCTTVCDTCPCDARPSQRTLYHFLL